MNQKEKLQEATMLALQGKLQESRPNWNGWDNIALSNASNKQLLQLALDTTYIVDCYTVDDKSFIHREVKEIIVPSSAFNSDVVTDNMVEEYIKNQLPDGYNIDTIEYKYYEDEKAAQKRVRQYLGKSKKDVDKEEKDAEQISYLQDRIFDYERHGRGTKQQYEKDLEKLHQLQELQEDLTSKLNESESIDYYRNKLKEIQANYKKYSRSDYRYKDNIKAETQCNIELKKAIAEEKGTFVKPIQITNLIKKNTDLIPYKEGSSTSIRGYHNPGRGDFKIDTNDFKDSLKETDLFYDMQFYGSNAKEKAQIVKDLLEKEGFEVEYYMSDSMRIPCYKK